MAKRCKRGEPKNPNPRDLPDLCWESIFSYLPNHDLQSISLVSKHFHSISNNLFFNLKISHSRNHRHFLPLLLNRFPFLKAIHFDYKNHRNTLEQSVLKIARSGHKNLEELVLNLQKCLPVKAIKELGFIKMTSLKVLCISNLKHLDDSDLSVVATSLPWLQELNISIYPSDDLRRLITDKGIAELAAKLRDLIRINISGNKLISDQSLHCLLSSCVHIAEIYCSKCKGITEKGLADAICGYSNLKHLKSHFDYRRTDSDGCCIELVSVWKSGEILSLIGAHMPLEKLIISVSYCKDESISSICQSLVNVRAIELRHCFHLTFATLCALAENCHSLVELEMSDTLLGKQIRGRRRALVGKNYAVKMLKLHFNRDLNDKTFEKVVGLFPNLESLEVSDTSGVTEEGIGYALNNLPELRRLKVTGGRRSNAPWAEVDGQVSELMLEVLDISDICGKGMDVIAKRCPHLVHLEIDGCMDVTAKYVKKLIRRCKKLKEVSLRNLYHEIDFDFDDASEWKMVSEVKTFPNLETQLHYKLIRN